MARAHGWAAPVTLQPQYNLLVRDIEHEVVPACLDAGIGLLPWSPLAGGWLAGKYKRDVAPTGAPASARTRSAAWRPTGPATPSERTWAVIDAVAGGRGGAGRHLGAGGAGLGGGAAGGHLGHPRRAHRRAARRQPRRRRPDLDADEIARLTRSAPAAWTTTPTAPPASRSATASSGERRRRAAASSLGPSQPTWDRARRPWWPRWCSVPGQVGQLSDRSGAAPGHRAGHGTAGVAVPSRRWPRRVHRIMRLRGRVLRPWRRAGRPCRR